MSGDFSNWYILDPEDRVISWTGDSSTYGTATTLYGPAEIMRRTIAKRWGLGTYGLQSTINKTTISGSWTRATTSDAWDVGPMLGQVFSLQFVVQRASSSTSIMTWNKDVGTTITGFIIHCVDGASSGNFSYRIDGTGSWINVSHSWSQNNSIVRLTINTAVNQYVEVRAADSGGSAVTTYYIGIEPIAGTGAVVHQLGGPSEATTAIIRSTAGQWDAWYQAVQPPIAIMQCCNDTATHPWDNTGYESRVQSFINMVRGYGGEPILVSYWHLGFRDNDDQDEFRQINHDLASDNDVYLVDLRDYAEDNATAIALNYLGPDETHPSNEGAKFIADRVAAPLLNVSGLARRRIS